MRPLSLAALFVLVGCAGQAPAPETGSKLPQSAPAALVVRAQLSQPLPATAAAREAFARACPALLRRADRSGLTQAEEWSAACQDPDQKPASFFARHFTPVRLGTGRGLTTGYFEPELTGTRVAKPGSSPIYGKPADLTEVDLTPFASRDEALKGRSIRGRWTGKNLVPYYSRAEIDGGALANRSLEIAWADDAIELFFLEIQGSGRLKLPDGEILRIGYAAQNGHPYVAIGRLLKQRKILEKASMEEIIAWIRANPAAGRALMRENPSFVFFQIGDPNRDGPLGSLGVPLIAEANAAADPATLPLGAPVLASFSLNGSPKQMLLIASDTSGAIRGANRIDIFWGAGPLARATASGLAAPINMLLLLPNAAAARLAE